MAKFNKQTAKKNGQKGGKISKRKPLDEQWRDKLNKSLGEGDRTTLDAIYGILLNAAKDGNIKAIEVLLERSYGKANQNITVNEAQEINPMLEQMRAIRQELEDKRKPKIIEVKAENG